MSESLASDRSSVASRGTSLLATAIDYYHQCHARPTISTLAACAKRPVSEQEFAQLASGLDRAIAIIDSVAPAPRRKKTNVLFQACVFRGRGRRLRVGSVLHGFVEGYKQQCC